MFFRKLFKKFLVHTGGNHFSYIVNLGQFSLFISYDLNEVELVRMTEEDYSCLISWHF